MYLVVVKNGMQMALCPCITNMTEFVNSILKCT